jgi:N-methylhydantoinase A
LALRYQGQSFELEIKETRKNIARSFHKAHMARYGYAQESNVVEVVSARLRSIGVVEKLSQRRAATSRSPNAKAVKQVEAWFEGKKHKTAVYHREALKAGMKLRAPAIVIEYSATTLVPMGAKSELDSYGNLIIQSGQ